jgi:hypothetical protein
LTNTVPHRHDTPHSPQRATITTLSILTLSLLFFITGTISGIEYRQLNADPILILLVVPFSLAMTGALVLFYFLHSSAKAENAVYKVGGAIAGFVVLFGSFYSLTKEPFLDELNWYKAASSPLSSQLISMAIAYDKINKHDNSSLTEIGASAVNNVNADLWHLAQGTYSVDETDLWTHLKPLIKHAKSTYDTSRSARQDGRRWHKSENY